MAYFFISYRHPHRDDAVRLAEILGADGHQVFLDESDIQVGDDWQKRISQALHACDAVLALVTPGYPESGWCVAEVAIAIDRGKRVLPFVRDASPETIPFLERAQYWKWSPEHPEAILRLRSALKAYDTQWPQGRPTGPLANGLIGSARRGLQNPFPGLESFDSKRSWAYFGRAREIREVLERLRATEPAARVDPVFIVGPSGCGKSSLAQAGVLPRILAEPGWAALPTVPVDQDLLTPLAAAFVVSAGYLGLDDWTAQGVRERLRPEGDGDESVPTLAAFPTSAGLRAVADDLLARAVSTKDANLLIVLDQVDEAISTQGRSAMAAVAGLLSAAAGPRVRVRVLATLRSEFLDRLRMAEGFPQIQLFLLRSIDRSQLRDVIREPAKEAKREVEPKLVDLLVRDTGSGDALPLLALTLRRLFEATAADGRLDVEGYERVGTVHDALDRQAGEALMARVDAGRDRQTVLTSLLELVAIGHDGEPVCLRRPWRDIGAESHADLDAFEARRLLRKTDDGYVIVTHEAGFIRWQPLKDMMGARQALLLEQRAAKNAAEEWERTKHEKAVRLWSLSRLDAALLSLLGAQRPAGRGHPLHGLRRLTGYRSEILDCIDQLGTSEGSRAFLKESYRQGRRHRCKQIFIACSVALVVAGLFTSAVYKAVEANSKAHDAETEKGNARYSQCKAVSERLVQNAQGLRDNNPRDALRLGLAASTSPCHTDNATSNLLTLQELYFDRTETAPSVSSVTHVAAVHALAASPDGLHLATATEGKGVDLIDLRGNTHRPLRFAGPAYAVAFDRGGDLLAVAGRSGDIAVWNLPSGRPPALIHGTGEPVNGIVFSRDSTQVITAGQDGTVRTWDVATLRETGRAWRTNGSPFEGLAASPDGRLLATAGSDTDVVLWDVASGTPRATLRGHTGPVRAVAFSVDGTSLASASDDGSVRLWNTANPSAGATVVLTGHNDRVRAVAFSPDGEAIASGGDDASVRLWHWRSGQQRRAFAGPTGSVSGLAFTAGGLSLAGAGLDGSVGLWDVATGGPEAVPGTSAVAFGPAGSGLLATGAPRHPITLWDTTGRRAPLVLGGSTPPSAETEGVGAARSAPGTSARRPATDGAEPFALAFSPDGALLAGALSGGRIGLWRTADGRLETTLTGHVGAVYSIAFSPDGEMLVSGGQDASVRLWTLQHGTVPPTVFHGHLGPVRSVAFSPDGDHFASGSDDGSVGQYDKVCQPGKICGGNADSGGWRAKARYHHLPPVDAVAFSPDSMVLASGSEDHTVALWPVRLPGDPPSSIISGPSQPIVSLAFSPDGKLIAGAAADGTLQLWDGGDAHASRGIIRTRRSASAVAFSSDGRQIASAGDNGTPALWQVEPAAVEASICALDLELTPQQWRQYVPDVPPWRECP